MKINFRTIINICIKNMVIITDNASTYKSNTICYLLVKILFGYNYEFADEQKDSLGYS